MKVHSCSLGALILLCQENYSIVEAKERIVIGGRKCDRHGILSNDEWSGTKTPWMRRIHKESDMVTYLRRTYLTFADWGLDEDVDALNLSARFTLCWLWAVSNSRSHVCFILWSTPYSHATPANNRRSSIIPWWYQPTTDNGWKRNNKKWNNHNSSTCCSVDTWLLLKCVMYLVNMQPALLCCRG